MPAKLDILRNATSDAHRRLESKMNLGPETMTRERVGDVLLRFRDFYLEWEAWIAQAPLDPVFLRERAKLPLLERDCAALGLSASAPVSVIGWALPDAADAWGSIYVIEGSTLGGQVINRWLAKSDWLPAGGLAYFDSYGPRVGAMWRTFRDELERHCPDDRMDAAVASANRTFAGIEACMTGSRAAA